MQGPLATYAREVESILKRLLCEEMQGPGRVPTVSSAPPAMSKDLLMLLAEQHELCATWCEKRNRGLRAAVFRAAAKALRERAGDNGS